RAGDTLLLETSPRFLNLYRNSSDFFLISKLDDSTPPQHEKRWIARVILGLMIGCIALQLTTVLNAAILAAAAMLISRCTTGENARNSLDWRVLITIGAAFALGEAMQSSGLAELIGSGVGNFSAGHPLWALAIIFAVTALLTSLVSNNAAAVIMFPIALAASQQLEVSFMPFAMTLMMAASASFASPIGYQTNLMVAGPGGYHFADFLRAGIPLTLVVALVTVTLAPMIWPF
ncbi:MAG TPA: SLC13 family permease, partial [Gammaproteobacteria bacterium]|nr:SLC13 family permease [Gammaproteobacteria bacterium]